MKHVYCIEGADNVGKSTLIKNMKKEEYCSHYPYKRVVFKKFPTEDEEVYNIINKMNDTINEVNDVETKAFWQNELMAYMLFDMSYIYDSDLMNDYLVISDRGPLSTYLYQYRRRIVDSSSNYKDISVDKERLLLYNFFTHKVSNNTTNDINIVVLYNNRKDNELLQDESEEVKFKKQYDEDKKLQEDINKALDNIKKIVEDGFEEVQTKFYFIDIYDKDGNRKTPDDITKEVIDIIKGGV